MLKIIADENIPFAQALFSQLGEVTLLPGRHMAASDLVGADILLVRSVTKVNASLLAQSQVKFVGTCTIGVDHLDKAFLMQQGIAYASAPGCNARGVLQYVLAAMAQLGRLGDFPGNRSDTGGQLTSPPKLGIVGCGNVGGTLYRVVKQLGFDCVVVDPFLSSAKIPDLAPFEAIYSCDIVCLHTPLTTTGAHPTFHMFNAQVLQDLKDGAMLLNAGRGEVIDNLALLRCLRAGKSLDVVLDVWESEPAINTALFDLVRIGTPHIAGYSYEGRVNGSTMIFQALAEFLGRDRGWMDEKLAQLRWQAFGEPDMLSGEGLPEIILNSHDIAADHQRLAAALAGLPASFDALRKNYPKRREFCHYRIAPELSTSVLASYLGAMGCLM